MEKLQEHLFDPEPLKFDFKIDKSSQKRFNEKSFRMKVTAYSDTPQKLIKFFTQKNYSHLGDQKERINLKLTDSVKA